MNLFDALDSAHVICILDTSPEIAYGPYDLDEAAEFIGKWNGYFSDRGMPGCWIAIPLIKK